MTLSSKPWHPNPLSSTKLWGTSRNTFCSFCKCLTLEVCSHGSAWAKLHGVQTWRELEFDEVFTDSADSVRGSDSDSAFSLDALDDEYSDFDVDY